jgi:hypothetical protein
MSNPKTEKIMKKLLYSVLALAGIFAVSCNKEIEAPVAPEHNGNTHKVTLKAAFANEGATRTEYANNKTFSWVEGDVVYVRCLNEEEEKWYWAPFVAETSGEVTDLTGEVDDGYEPYDVAVYVPGDNYVGSAYYNESTVRVVAPISYHEDGYGLVEASDGNSPYWNSVEIPSDNPLSLLPLVSVTKDETLYFQTAMGVLKLNLTDVPAAADHVRITSADNGALGNYLMVQDGEIRMSEPWYSDEGQRYATSFAEYYFEPVSDGKVSFLMPLPVGTLVADSTVELLDSEGNVLFTKSFKKDVVIARNKITELVELSAKVEWKSIGTGKYYDSYIWNLAGWTADEYVDVEIFQDASDDKTFRISSPYGAAAKKFNYTPAGTVVPASDVLTLKISKDDYVDYGDHQTGVYDADYDEGTMFFHPKNYFGIGRNLVAKYGADGIPANIILAPVYEWETAGYWTSSNFVFDNDVIQILFPGVNAPVDLTSFIAYGEIVDDTPSQAVATASIEFGADMATAKLVIAANEDDARAAIAAGTQVTEATEEGSYEVLFPADAPSGDYQVYALVSPKEGFTAAAADLIASTTFKYIRSDQDLGYKIDDIVGTYESTQIWIAYYKGGWQWEKGHSYLVIEESDDDLLGNVMITEVAADTEQGGYDLYPNTDNVAPIYGTFNTRSGELSFDPCQPLYESTANGDYWTLVGEREDYGSNFFMSAPGSMESIGRSFIGSLDPATLSLEGYYRIVGGSPGVNIAYTRQEESEAAANAAPAKRRTPNCVEKAYGFGVPKAAVPMIR